MSNLKKLLSSPRVLIVFEAAARLSSFTAAAKELNMQQPSVSAAIKQLELSLGVILFTREHRHVALTSTGQRLYIDVSKSLNDIYNSLESVRKLGSNDYVTISSSSAFSFYWLMPRMSVFRTNYPNIDLRMQNSDREPELINENISLGIRLGNGYWPGYHTVKIADEVIYPVASAQVMQRLANSDSIVDLKNERLIHLEEPIRKRPTWSQWFRHKDIDFSDTTGGLRLNDYVLVLQAALSGEGFAFGWHHIVKDLLAKNCA